MSFVCCFVYMLKKYPVLHFGIKDIKLEKGLVKSMFAIGCSMGFMSSLINIGSVALQGAINSLNNANYIVAHYCGEKDFRVFHAAVYRVWNNDGNILRSEYGGKETRQDKERNMAGNDSYMDMVCIYGTFVIYCCAVYG